MQYEPITRACAQRQGPTWQNNEWNLISAAVNDQAETREQRETPGQSLEHR